MKLFNQFTILPRYLKAFNYAGNRMEEIKRNLDRDNHLFEDYYYLSSVNLKLKEHFEKLAKKIKKYFS